MIVERSQRLADGVASASLVQSGPHEARSVSSTTEEGAELQSLESVGALQEDVELRVPFAGSHRHSACGPRGSSAGSVCPIRTFLVTLLEDGMAELSPRLSWRPSSQGVGHRACFVVQTPQLRLPARGNAGESQSGGLRDVTAGVGDQASCWADSLHIPRWRGSVADHALLQMKELVRRDHEVSREKKKAAPAPTNSCKARSTCESAEEYFAPTTAMVAVRQLLR